MVLGGLEWKIENGEWKMNVILNGMRAVAGRPCDSTIAENAIPA